MTTAATTAQARLEQATARMQKWSRIYGRHPGIKMNYRQQDGRWIWGVTQPGSPATIYADVDAMMAALLPDEPPS
jgi:hypothetical protein